MVQVTTGGGYIPNNLSDKEKVEELIKLCSIIESENVKYREEIKNLKKEIFLLKNGNK